MALRKWGKVPQLDSLGLPGAIPGMLTSPSGLILVVGGTGSGKSTTLASCIDYINRAREAHILTLEAPIEYIHTQIKCRIRQRLIGPGKDCSTFADGITAAMREDPDVIMVGEVRDKATMSACLAAAQTGHLVMGTLHTNSAAEAVERALSFFPEGERDLARSILSNVLRAVIAQRLLPGLSSSKRVLACEVMVVTPGIRANISNGEIVQIEQAMESGLREGQRTMNHALLELYRSQDISRETALMASPRRDILERRMS